MSESNFEISENQVFIHKNTKRKGREPDYWGKMMIEGKEYRVSLWSKTSKNSGNTFLKGSAWEFRSERPKFKIEG